MFECNITTGEKVSSWILGIREHSDLKVTPVGLSECMGWHFLDGGIVHLSKCFFKVIGIHAFSSLPHLNDVEQPIIDQPEVGVLGFLVKKTPNGWNWLLQAKTEPGNVNGVQVGPSVQATQSNYERKHGGRPTPMIQIFVGNNFGCATIVTDVEQSEQGDRFLGKYNRNCVAIVSDDCPVPQSNLWSWFPSNELRKALKQDFLVNTDARSVIFCSDWALLADDDCPPFSRWRGSKCFGESLLKSYECIKPDGTLNEVRTFLENKRSSSDLSLKKIALTDLKGWHISVDGVSSTDNSHAFSVKTFSVSTSDREVAFWNQPLLVGERIVNISMVCANISGTLHFLLRASEEIGLIEISQFAPTLIDDSSHTSIEWVAAALEEQEAIIHCSVLQSDEGGRFMNSVCRYSIIEVNEKWATEINENGVWVTLAQLKQLAHQKGLLTNEARSVLSLLLAWV